MEQELTYTFKFGIRAKSMSLRDDITVRQVPYSKLLDSFEAALDWVLANPKDRYAEMFGPGMMTRTVTHSVREYILKQLPDNLPKKRTIIGLAWMDLGGNPLDRAYKMYKVWSATVPLPDLPDRPETHYGLLEVDPDDFDRAFEWARANRWHDFGIWVAGKPGLVFGPDFEAVARGCGKMVEILQHLPTHKLERAPCRYDWQYEDQAYPKMAPTRDRRVIQTLRSRFPTAGDNLLYAPLEILLWQYGYGRAR